MVVLGVGLGKREASGCMSRCSVVLNGKEEMKRDFKSNFGNPTLTWKGCVLMLSLTLTFEVQNN